MARKVLSALVALLLSGAPAAAQQATPGQVSYVEGLRAFDAGDYGTAAARMRTALAEDPREAVSRFRYRAQNAEDYFPHLWLGLSLEKLGDRDGALVELRESQAQGAVETRPALRRILGSALGRLTPPTPVPTAPQPTPAAEPAREVVAAATPTPLPTAPPARVAVAPPVASPFRPPAVPAVATPPSREATAAALHAGVRAFFRGDYGGAERLLAPEAGRSPVARLFLAFSLGGRYLLAEPGNAELLAQARTEYAGALLAGAPAAGGPWVSPAILALFGAANGP